MADETTGVRITQQAIYAKQLEHGETLVKILEKLDHFRDYMVNVKRHLPTLGANLSA
jgi:hypothetical protein